MNNQWFMEKADAFFHRKWGLYLAARRLERAGHAAAASDVFDQALHYDALARRCVQWMSEGEPCE